MRRAHSKGFQLGYGQNWFLFFKKKNVNFFFLSTYFLYIKIKYHWQTVALYTSSIQRWKYYYYRLRRTDSISKAIEIYNWYRNNSIPKLRWKKKQIGIDFKFFYQRRNTIVISFFFTFLLHFWKNYKKMTLIRWFQRSRELLLFRILFYKYFFLKQIFSISKPYLYKGIFFEKIFSSTNALQLFLSQTFYLQRVQTKFIAYYYRLLYYFTLVFSFNNLSLVFFGIKKEIKYVKQIFKFIRFLNKIFIKILSLNLFFKLLLIISITGRFSKLSKTRILFYQLGDTSKLVSISTKNSSVQYFTDGFKTRFGIYGFKFWLI